MWVVLGVLRWLGHLFIDKERKERILRFWLEYEDVLKIHWLPVVLIYVLINRTMGLNAQKNKRTCGTYAASCFVAVVRMLTVDRRTSVLHLHPTCRGPKNFTPFT